MEATRNENRLLAGVASGCVICATVLGLLFLWVPASSDVMLKLLVTLIVVGGACVFLLAIRWLRRELGVREPEDYGESGSSVAPKD